MAEGRMLKKAISNSRRVSELSSDTARLIYTWMIAHLDVEGRFSAEPSLIKGNVFPRIKTITEEVIEDCLKEMNNIGLLSIYEVDGDTYFQLRKFEEHQTGLRKDREAPSKIPKPTPEQLQNRSGATLENSGLREEKRSKEKFNGSEVAHENNGVTPDELKDLFNTCTHFLPKVTELGKTRTLKIKTRIKEGKDTLEYWRVVFIKADNILIPGKNGKKDWFPNFDWLIENEGNARKVFEGNYDDAKRPQSPGKTFEAGKLWESIKEQEDERKRSQTISAVDGQGKRQLAFSKENVS